MSIKDDESKKEGVILAKARGTKNGQQKKEEKENTAKRDPGPDREP